MKIRKLKIYLSLFCLSLGLSFLIYFYMNSRIEISDSKTVLMPKILWVNQRIQANEIIKPEFCDIKDCPSHLIPEKALTSLDQLGIQKAAFTLSKGDILTYDKLIASDKMPNYVLEKNERALFLPYEESLSLLANDRVDLVLTHKFKKIKEGLIKEKTQSQILLPYARILEISYSDKTKNKQKGFVLAVPKESVSKILLSSEIGKISLVKYSDYPEEMENLDRKFTNKDLNIKTKKTQKQEAVLIKGQKIENHVF